MKRLRLVIAMAIVWGGVAISAPSPDKPGQGKGATTPSKASTTAPADTAPLSAGLNPFEAPEFTTRASVIDELVFSQLEKLGIKPARPCSDSVFLRRAFLDVIGTLPTVRESAQFYADRSANKRAALIDRLLAREEYVDYWAMKWCDVLRVKAEFPINLWPNAAQAYHRWIRTAVRDNMPYDRFAREMLTSSGSNFRVPPVNFYRAMQNREPAGIAQTVALTFMGQRADKWPEEKLSQMAAFFGKVGAKGTQEWKEEVIFFDPSKTNATPLAEPHFPDGSTPGKSTHGISGDADPRLVFADWLIRPENPWFTRAIANRCWGWFMGRGIVHEVDDIRPDNPPVNPALLSCLERELRNSKYDIRQLMRLILNSRTYQLSPIPADPSRADEARGQFAFYPVRRLEAEVLIDALNQVTGGAEHYTSVIPEPFTFIPEDFRAIALPDGSISSPFLELFGRPARDTGMESERNNRITAAQRLHLLNSTQIQRKLEDGPQLEHFLKTESLSRPDITGLYLSILSRHPSESESEAALTYARKNKGKPREAALDLAWALINSAEFLHRH